MKLTMTSGNFSAEIDGEVDSVVETQQTILDAGIRYITEREGFGEVYKQLGGKLNEKGKLSLPKDFKRTNVPFTVENAEKFASTLTGVLGKLGDFAVVVTEYVPDEGGGMKKAQALYDAAKKGGKLQALADHESIAFEGEITDEKAFVEHIHAVKYAKKSAESELASLGV